MQKFLSRVDTVEDQEGVIRKDLEVEMTGAKGTVLSRQVQQKVVELKDQQKIKGVNQHQLLQNVCCGEANQIRSTTPDIDQKPSRKSVGDGFSNLFLGEKYSSSQKPQELEDHNYTLALEFKTVLSKIELLDYANSSTEETFTLLRKVS